MFWNLCSKLEIYHPQDWELSNRDMFSCIRRVKKVGAFPDLAIAAASDQIGVPELQRRNGVLVTHRGRVAWKTTFWDDIFSKAK